MVRREFVYEAPSICDGDDLRPLMIDMRLQQLGRMYSRSDPRLFMELFGRLQEDEIDQRYMEMVELDSRDRG